MYTQCIWTSTYCGRPAVCGLRRIGPPCACAGATWMNEVVSLRCTNITTVFFPPRIWANPWKTTVSCTKDLQLGFHYLWKKTAITSLNDQFCIFALWNFTMTTIDCVYVVTCKHVGYVSVPYETLHSGKYWTIHIKLFMIQITEYDLNFSRW